MKEESVSAIDEERLMQLIADVRTKGEGHLKSPEGAALLDHMSRESALAKFDDNHMVYAGGSVCSAHMNVLADWLLEYSSARGVEPPVRRLGEFLRSSDVAAIQVALLAGVRFSEPFCVTDSLTLVPIEMLNRGGIRQWMDSATFNPPTGHWDMLLSKQFCPSAAVVKNFRMPCGMTPRDEYFTPLDNPPSLDCEPRAIKVLSTLLTVVGPSVNQLLTVWSEPDEDVPGLFGFGGAYPHLLSSWEQGGETRTLSAEDLAVLPDLYKRFVALPASFQSALTIALERLNSSLRRRQPVDQAIDLGIAMETLLLDGKSQDGIALPFRLRGAYFLSPENVEERLRLERLFNAMYALRSTAVHDGKVEDICKISGDKVPSLSVLRECQEHCAMLIRKIIVLGRRPMWGQLILGGPA